jgi:hypothetical protein
MTRSFLGCIIPRWVCGSRRFERSVVRALWTYLANDAVSDPRRRESSITPLWEPHTSLIASRLFQTQVALEPCSFSSAFFHFVFTCAYLSADPSGMPDIEAQVFSFFWLKETFFVPYFSQYGRTLSFPAFLCINGIQVPDLITVLLLTPRAAERIHCVFVQHVNNCDGSCGSYVTFGSFLL